VDTVFDLANVKDRSRSIPLDRWDIELLGRTQKGRDVPRFACLLGGVENFDVAGFGISPPEAIYMDPQQRLLLESSVELSFRAFGNGNCFAPDTGVFVGASWMDYSDLVMNHTGHVPSPYSASGMLSL
jgi:acyl transferase domain-containing protein